MLCSHHGWHVAWYTRLSASNGWEHMRIEVSVYLCVVFEGSVPQGKCFLALCTVLFEIGSRLWGMNWSAGWLLRYLRLKLATIRAGKGEMVFACLFV